MLMTSEVKTTRMKNIVLYIAAVRFEQYSLYMRGLHHNIASINLQPY